MDIPLGPYLLHQPIGQGAMGTVWSGVHRAQRVPVAVKVLGGEGVIRPSFRKAFRTEVRAVAALDHPHVVLVHDHGEIDAEAAKLSGGALAEGVPWLVMEWASGGNLASNLPWGWDALRDTLDTLLGALAHVHARGVVHRDLKPANVLVCGPDDARPGLKLADFGIVRLQDDPDTENIAGTPTYMAPEQAVRGGRIGPWTDLYALGGVAWEMATGKTPFDDLDPRAILRAHRWTAPPAFAPRFPVPAGLEGWLRRLLAKAPESRFPLAADAAWALSRLGSAAAAVPSTPSSRSTSATWATTHDTVTDVPTEAADTEEVSRSQEPAVAEAPVEVPPIPATWAVDTTRGALLRGAGLGLYGLRAIPMVDREAEREALWSALRAVDADGKPRAVVIAGPAGCGKSRLAEWLCDRAHELGAAQSVRAVHAPRPGPQDGIPGLISRHLGLGTAPERVEERLSAWLGPSADPFLSAGLRSLLGRGDADHLGPRDRHRVVCRVLERATRDRPLIVWLDDVQWGQDALDLARYLLDDGARPPLLLVLTAREEALAERPVEAAALAALRAERLEVGPLAPEHRRKLVQDLLGLEGAVAATIEERTAGNPLFAVQLVGDWVERGLLELGPRGFRLREGASVALPDGLHTMWADRIDRLCSTRDPADVLTLEVAAVLGQEVDPDEWAAACAREGLTPSQELVDVLLAQRLAREEGGRWAFVHGMLRESLERMAAEEGRIAAHHLACAAALEALAPSDVYTGSGARGLARERLGRHLLAGGRPEQAWQPLLDGASIRHDRGEVDAGLIVLAEAEQALAGAPEADPRWGHVWAQRGALLTRRGAVAEAEADYQRVLFEAEGPEWEVLAARAQTHLGIAARLRSDLKASTEMLAQAEARATAAGDAKIACLARIARGATAHAAGRREEGITLAKAALEEAEANGWWEAHTQAMYWLGVTALQAGKLEDAKGWLMRVREASERVGYRPAVLECCTVLGDIARHRGDLELAELHYREARAHAVAMDASGLDVVELNLGLVLVERGQHAEAVAPLQSCAVAFRESGRKAFAGATGLLLAACAAAAGDAEAWDAVATEAITTIRASGIVYTDVARCAELAGEAADLAGWPERASPAWDLAGDQWSSLGRRRELG